MATTAVTAIVDEELSQNASEVLAEIGMTVDQALKLLLTQVVHDRCLPFSLHLPNAETIAAMEELERGEGKRFATVDDLFHDMRQ